MNTEPIISDTIESFGKSIEHDIQNLTDALTSHETSGFIRVDEDGFFIERL